MAATAYLPLAFALQAPTWIFFRRMDFARQRLLQGIVPVVTFAVTVPLAAGGAGVWSLVIGPAVGNLRGGRGVAAVAVAVPAAPAPVGPGDRAALSALLRSGCARVVARGARRVQGQVLAIDLHEGLAAVGFVTLAATFARYIDRADQIVTVTIYPAICTIRGRTAALAELFVRSNRATLLWTLPAAAGIVLFSQALVDHVLGPAWDPAVPLMQGLAVAAALQQVGFNWFSFYRAHGESRPGAIEAGAGAAAFLAFRRSRADRGRVSPASSSGAARASLVQLGVRARYIRALLPSVRARRRARPAAGAGRARRRRGRDSAAALVPGWSGDTGAAALAEIALFTAVVAGAERRASRGRPPARARRRAPRLGRAAAEEEAGEGDRDEGEGGHLPVPVQAGVQRPGERGGGGAGGEGAVGA